MFCPVCKGEFRDGFKTCDICKVGLVEDLDNLPDFIEGEFKVCPECGTKYDDNVEICDGCDIKVVRALEGKDGEGFVYLEEPDYTPVHDFASANNFDTSAFKHCVDLSQYKTDTLLESEDMELMYKLMDALDNKGIDFAFVPPTDEVSSTLGSIFGMNSPLARSFPKIVVKVSDLDSATAFMTNNTDLGIFDIPEELMGGDEDEEEEEEN